MDESILYIYKAKVVRVVDGDTVDVDIDLGFHAHITERIRLYGINAPELKGEQRSEGLAAKKFLLSLIPEGSEVFLQTYRDKKGKYGRYLAEIILNDGPPVTELMVANGHAVEKSYD